MVRGICHQNSPVAQTAAASVRTIGVPMAPERAVHVGVRIRGDDEGSRKDVAALDHDLVADAGAGRIEIDSMFPGEGFDGPVFLQVSLVMILDVVIEGEDQLLGVVDLRGAYRFEFAHHRRRVVVGHGVKRPDRNEVAGAQQAFRAIGEVGLRDLFDNGLRHG